MLSGPKEDRRAKRKEKKEARRRERAARIETAVESATQDFEATVKEATATLIAAGVSVGEIMRRVMRAEAFVLSFPPVERLARLGPFNRHIILGVGRIMMDREPLPMRGEPKLPARASLQRRGLRR